MPGGSGKSKKTTLRNGQACLTLSRGVQLMIVRELSEVPLQPLAPGVTKLMMMMMMISTLRTRDSGSHLCLGSYSYSMLVPSSGLRVPEVQSSDHVTQARKTRLGASEIGSTEQAVERKRSPDGGDQHWTLSTSTCELSSKKVYCFGLIT